MPSGCCTRKYSTSRLSSCSTKRTTSPSASNSCRQTNVCKTTKKSRACKSYSKWSTPARFRSSTKRAPQSTLPDKWPLNSDQPSSNLSSHLNKPRASSQQISWTASPRGSSTRQLTERRVLWTKQPRAPSNEHVLTESDPSNSLCASQPGARPRTQPVVYTIRGIPSFNYSAHEPAFFRHYNRLEHSPTRNHTCIPN